MAAPDPGFDRRFTPAAPGLWAMVMIHAGALLALLPAARPTPALLALCAATYALRMFAVTAGFHRYFAHRAFKTSRAVQFLFAFIGGMAVVRGALWWAAHHRAHHRHSDERGDPHSPIHGLWWSHMGWFMARGNQATRRELIPDLTRFPELVWLDRNELAPILVFVAVCFGVGAGGAALAGTPVLAGGFAAWVWGANVSSVLLCHSIFSLNSVSHAIGSRRYDVGDRSTNQPLVALATFGEGWHNNHHRWPGRAYLGEGWREVDISWYGLRLLAALGLVSDLRGQEGEARRLSA